MTTFDTPKTPRDFVEAMLRSSIEADRLVSERINDARFREAHTHTAINGLVAAMAMQMLRRFAPTAADSLAGQLDRILTAGDVGGPAYRTAQVVGLNPDEWITEFEQRAERRAAARENDVRDTLATLADRWEQMADRAPKHPEYLYIDPLTPAQRDEHERAVAYRKAAADVRDVLRTGHVPHDLMTDEELKRYGTPAAPTT